VSLPAGTYRGLHEPEAAATPRRDAVAEGVATTALMAILMLRDGQNMTIAEAAPVVAQAVEDGLNAIAAEHAGLLAVGGQALRDHLELAAWRMAVSHAGALRKVVGGGDNLAPAVRKMER